MRASRRLSRLLQRRIAVWVRSTFGQASMDRTERARRFYEEATELCQSVGMSVEDARAITEYVYSRPSGHRVAELGGAGLTLMALAESFDADVAVCVAREWQRVSETDQGYFRNRNQRKRDAGISR